MKKNPDAIKALAFFGDDSRRCGIRVRRVNVLDYWPAMESASVEYKDGFFPVGRIVRFSQLSRSPRDLGAKIRAAFPLLSRLGPGSPAASQRVA